MQNNPISILIKQHGLKIIVVSFFLFRSFIRRQNHHLFVVVLPVIIVVPVIILLRKRILHLLLVDLSISTGIGKRCSKSSCVTSLEGEVTGQSAKGSSSSKNLTGRLGQRSRSGLIDVAPPVLVVGRGSPIKRGWRKG